MEYSESRRRSIIKSIVWRFIGIFWTWGGAYVIILFLPEKQKTAFNIASLVTLWHHSTRMIMYYAYERLWAKINWGRHDKSQIIFPISRSHKLYWSIGTIFCVSIILWLLLSVTPSIKENQKAMINSSTYIESGSSNAN
jgi:transcription initiation factor IIE alpha subunit